MIYEQLFARHPHKTVRAGIIGLGNYATAILAQAQCMPRLSVPVVADLSIDVAREACRRAGIPRDDVVVCSSRSDAVSALDRGRQQA